jgi:hypothetical protein
MSKPNSQTKFKLISELVNYSDDKKYFCSGIVFSPETENDHFRGCPPYIEINEVNDYESNNTLYFEVPKIVAYYGSKHAGYTMKGREQCEEVGKSQLAFEIRKLLNIK